jgi:hypothetical protein
MYILNRQAVFLSIVIGNFADFLKFRQLLLFFAKVFIIICLNDPIGYSETADLPDKEI